MQPKQRASGADSTGSPRPRRGPRHDLTVDLGLLAIAVIWGMNFPIVKAILRELDPLAFNALRFPCAAFALWFLLKAQGRRLMPDRKDWRTVMALGMAGHVVYQLCFIFGLDLTLTGNAAILLSTAPVWVLFISVALGRERFNSTILLGVLGTLAGAAILVTGGRDETGSVRMGDFLMLGAALSWSVYTVFSRRMTKRRGALEMTAWTLWAGLPFIMVMGIPALLRTNWTAVSAGAWLGIAYAGVFAIAIAYLLWYRGVRAIGQSRTSVYLNLVPVIALIAAWFWLEELPTAQQLVGAGVILSGVVVARRSRRR